MRPLLVLAVLLILTPKLHAQPGDDPARIVTFTHDGQAAGGYFVSIENDTLSMVVERGEVIRIAISDLQRVERLRAREPEFATIGVLGGFYGSVAAWSLYDIYTLDPQDVCIECRNGYMWNSATHIGLSAAVIIPLGWIGDLVDRRLTDTVVDADREIFLFEQDPDHRRAVAADLARAVEETTRRWSLSLHGGYIVTSSTTEELSSMGYSNSAGFWWNPRPRFRGPRLGDDLTSLLWVRRLELHYRIEPALDVGASIVNLADPGVVVARTDVRADERRIRSVAEGISGGGYFISGRFVPFPTARVGSGLVLTAGVGMIAGRFHRTGFDDRFALTHWGETSESMLRQVVSFSPAAAFASIGFSMSATPSTRVGISADIVASPSVTIPGAPSYDIADREFSPGNASVGFWLGWRF